MWSTFILLLVIYYVLHSLLAADKAKMVWQQVGLPRTYYRLIYNTFFVAFTIWLGYYFLKLDSTTFVSWSWWFRGPAALGLLIGCWIARAALRQYNLSEFIGTQYLQSNTQNHFGELNTTGWNARVRHPLYLATVIILWSIVGIWPQWRCLLVASISSLYLIVGIRLEERKLIAHFGDVYQQYQKSVPMLFPRFRL